LPVPCYRRKGPQISDLLEVIPRGRAPSSSNLVEAMCLSLRGLHYFQKERENMKSSNDTAAQHSNSSHQSIIVRFRTSAPLHERLTKIAAEEELCLAALVRKLILTALERFPS
jgi:hypothetical protein